MKQSKTVYRALVLSLLCLAAIINGCQQNPPEFVITKKSEGISKALTGFGRFQLITKYDVNFLAKGTAIINFTSESGAGFTASKLDPSQLQAVLTLLRTPGMKFDTLRKEYTIGLH